MYNRCGYKIKMSESSISTIEHKDDNQIILTFENGHKLLLGLERQCCEISLFFRPNLQAGVGQKIISITEDKNVKGKRRLSGLMGDENVKGNIDDPKSRFYGLRDDDSELIVENNDDKLYEKDAYYIKDNTINVNSDISCSRDCVGWHKYVIRLSNDEQLVLWSCTISNGYYDGELTIEYI